MPNLSSCGVSLIQETHMILYDIEKSMIVCLPEHNFNFMGINLKVTKLMQATEIERLSEHV